MTDDTYFERAKALIYNDRNVQYGTPLENFKRIAEGWQTIFRVEKITEEQVACALAWLKIARLVHGFKEDSLVDAIGYLGTVEMIQKERATPAPSAADPVASWKCPTCLYSCWNPYHQEPPLPEHEDCGRFKVRGDAAHGSAGCLPGARQAFVIQWRCESCTYYCTFGDHHHEDCKGVGVHGDQSWCG